MNPELIQVAETYIQVLYKKAEQHYNKKFPTPIIKWTLTGTKAGTAKFSEHELNFNYQLFEENITSYYNDIFIHEVSHLISYYVYGIKGIGHNQYWKSVMYSCFGAIPNRCHQMNTTNTKRVQKKYVYKCACNEHKISGKVHSNIQKNNQEYCCNTCKQTIIYTGKVA